MIFMSFYLFFRSLFGILYSKWFYLTDIFKPFGLFVPFVGFLGVLRVDAQSVPLGRFPVVDLHTLVSSDIDQAILDFLLFWPASLSFFRRRLYIAFVEAENCRA